MADLEYRIKTTSMGAISNWRPLGNVGEEMIWDYQGLSIKIEFFEIRVKPDFVPGYFRHIDGAECGASARWYNEDPGASFERVNVTPAE